jgi:magnesium-transporting ATPase (P-type)
MLDQRHLETARQESAALNADGFRVIAVAYKVLDSAKEVYGVADECDLTPTALAAIWVRDEGRHDLGRGRACRACLECAGGAGKARS